MRLSDDEKAMLDGKEGRARQKAMEILVRYGEALGAEKMVDATNVAGVMMTNRATYAKLGSFDAAFSVSIDSSEVVEFPNVKVLSCQMQQGMDPLHWEVQGFSREDYEFNLANAAYSAGLGVQLMYTCAPYLVGNLPVRGEHCAWMESSAVPYINSILGARCNVEGGASTTAAMLTGKIPYWGYHIDDNRLGTHLIEVECDVETNTDWGLLGYFAGKMVQERVPVIAGIGRTPNLVKLKHFGAAGASSGGVEIYHIPGITAEARTVAEAFGGKQPVATFKFGKAEKLQAYEELNAIGKDTNVDFVVFGCPHASIDQVWEIARLLEGKRVRDSVNLWIFVPRPIRDLADRNGYTKIINEAGGYLMGDTCPCLGRVMPKGSKVMATDSAKQAHYAPSILGVEAWYGSVEQCIDAAVTGQWRGEL
jgi:predicted aconitase